MIDEYRRLTDAALLRERGLFVAEGRLVLRRVVDDPRYQVRSVLLNDASRRDLDDVLMRLPSGTPVHVCKPDEIQRITGFNFHRGCLALVQRPPALTIDSLLTVEPPLVLLEDVANADNVGGAFRNAAAFGAGGIIVSPGCCDPLYRKAIRTSMGAVLNVPFARAVDWPAAIRAVRHAGFALVSLTPRQPSESIASFAQRAAAVKIALVVGTEGAGVSSIVEAVADARVTIPMAEGVDSLNLSVAVGVALFALRS